MARNNSHVGRIDPARSWLLIVAGTSLALALGMSALLASRAAATDSGPAALNIRTLDDQGVRLPGATYTIDGMDGTFTSGSFGQFCITGLPADSVWTVTQVEAPSGYELAQPSSQAVEVDDDGDCNSPDAVFVNGRSQASESTPTPKPAAPGTPIASPAPPRDDTLGGNPTPTPGQLLPDTASDGDPIASVPTALLVMLIASLAVLGTLDARTRRRRS
ncbi:MAG: prealbumin-like fold domain-containing protein [Candidatus Limnocylindria bacterium]